MRISRTLVLGVTLPLVLGLVLSSSVSAALLEVQFKERADAPDQTGWTQITGGSPPLSTTISGGDFDGVGISANSGYVRSHPSADYSLVNHADGGLGNLLSGGVLTNNAATNVSLQLTGLADGTYYVRTYHHTPYNPTDGLSFDLLLTDATVTNSLIHNDVPISFGPMVTTAGLARLDTVFTVSGGSTTTLTFDPEAGGFNDGPDHLNINGFQLSDEGFPPPPPPPVGPLKVDFGSTSGVGPLQPGFLPFDDAEVSGGGGPPKVRTYATAMGAGGTVDVTIDGYTHFRDYAGLTGAFAGESPLLSDMVLRNANGEMTLTFEDLLPGVYDIEMFHHSSQYGGGSFDIKLTDSLRTDRLMLTDVPVSDGTNPSSISTTMLRFVTDGSPVRIDFLGGSGGEHLSLNGFVLTIVPEPSTLLVWSLFAGLGIGCAWRRKR